MEKIKLSNLITYYEQKKLNNDKFFELYFEETDLESKLETLQLMYSVLGDVTLPVDYFKTFLYAGKYDEYKKTVNFTKSMIKDIYDIIKKYDDITKHILYSLLVYYNEEYFQKCKVKEYFDLLVAKYGFTKETEKRCIKYIEDSHEQIKDFYKKESSKLDLIKDQYPYDFIMGLKGIIESCHITFDTLIEFLPLNDFFKPTLDHESEFWAKFNDYQFMFELFSGRISLDDYQDDDYMVAFTQIGQYKEGIKEVKMYTSFTKKEYLDSIKKEKVKIK